jgi:hypothetical protein
VSLERGAEKKRAGSMDSRKKSKNRLISPKIEKFTYVNFKNSNFSENYDLLPWVQKSLLPSEIEESTYEREGELKIKLEKERVRGTKRETENFYKKIKKNWKGGGTIRKCV